MDKKRKTMDKRIIDSLQEGPLVAFYYVTAINYFKKAIEKMTDEELNKMFAGIMGADRVRRETEIVYNRLNHPTHNES